MATGHNFVINPLPCLRRFLALFLLALPVAPLLAASFDCAKAKTLFERNVCADEKLSRLDEERNRIFLDHIYANWCKLRSVFPPVCP
jgi:uncharacterized protein